jgi:multidrug efflux pump subunit AcrB
VRDQVLLDLQRVVGVAQIDVRGLSERTTVVRPDPVKLDAMGVVLFDLITALQSRSIDVPGGRITGTQTLRVDGAPTDPTSIGDLVIQQVNGAPVRLRDVAVVEETVERAGGDEPMLGIHAYDPTHAHEVIDRVRSVIVRTPPAITIVETKSPLPPRRKPQLVVQLRGQDMTALRSAADDITKRLAAKQVRDVVLDPPPGRPDEIVDVDRARATDLGISMTAVMSTLQALRGTPVGPVGIRFAEKLPDLIARLHVRGRDGVLVPLSDIASVKAGETGEILHRDQERTIELAIHTSGARDIVKSYKPPAGVRVMLSP